MAAKNIKSIEDVKNKIETTIDRIDVEKVDFGDIKMSDTSNGFILENEENLDQLVTYLNNFIDKISAEKEKVKTEKINDKLINELNSGGENASLIAEIFKK
ncbi:hypothetical protein [Staphylococcus hominis]|uniref:hypothetical protein n=1 Tax=Staphylococcus hominis TaxID=1290 RepID=UPI001F55D072|nr:hypothetical protein [Staphylococcus hominis]MCI2910911.1 hypothetical protein [Staphylococcus hominis]